MCYDTAQLAYKIYKDAVRLKGTPEEIEYLKDKWKRLKEGYPELHHASAFQHPEMLVFSKTDNKLDLSRSTWGLIPSWVESEERASQLWNNTVIARGESMFEKPSFKESATKGRCVIPIDGFFEHFHQNGKTFPYYIQRKDKKRMLLGGIKSSWINPNSGEEVDSFAMITTKANDLMSTIHNNPKIAEPRMPLLLNEEDIETWFEGSKEEIMNLIAPNTSQELDTKTVKPLRGKLYMGNVPEIVDEHEYDELTRKSDQTSLF